MAKRECHDVDAGDREFVIDEDTPYGDLCVSVWDDIHIFLTYLED